MTPEQLAKSESESAHQQALFCWAALKEVRELHPELQWMFAVPNGGQRPKPIALKMVAEGAKKGVPDIFLPVPRGPWFGLFIEMKRPKKREGKRKGVTSAEQKGYIKFLQSQGYGAMVCNGWDEARDNIIKYLEYGKNS